MNAKDFRLSPPLLRVSSSAGRFLSLLLAGGLALLCGCATSSIEQRRAQRAEAYAALSPEVRAQVDRGEVAQGMGMDAVFIAWGRPTKVTTRSGNDGREVEWWYYRNYIKSDPVWYYRPDGRGYPMMDVYYDTSAWKYVARKVVLRDGQVTWFRTYAPLLP
jgi:hypothetical protein